MNTIVAAFVDHPRMIITIACLVLVALIGVAVYRAGGNAVAGRMQSEQAIAKHKSDSVMAYSLGALLTVRRTNDSLRTRADSLAGVVAHRRTSASLVNSRLVLHGDTASVSTDTGVVVIPIPNVLTRQLAAMHLVNDSLVVAMDRQHAADTALVRGLTDQIAVDSTVQTEYRKQLAIAEARIAADESKPHHSLTAAFLAGAVATVAARIAVAVLTHH